MADSGSSRSASQPLSGSPLAAALEWWEDVGGEWTDILKRAARERLRLSKIPCETCGGEGVVDDYYAQFDKCPSCGGSGEVWADELVEAVANAPKSREFSGLFPDEARAVLDALDLYAKEAT